METIAHNLVHRSCAELPCPSAARTRRGSCPRFKQGYFFLLNQWLDVISTGLLTMLSTKDVQNAPTCPLRRRSAKMGARKAVLGARKALYPHLPHIDAASFYSIKTRAWPAVGAVAHNLIHKRCAEDLRASLPHFCAQIIFPFESGTCPSTSGIANNLIHSFCSEHRRNF